MKEKRSIIDKMKKYEVEAESVEDFIEKYHKPFPKDSLYQEQKKDNISTAKKEFLEYGYCLIPASSSSTGRLCTLINNELYNNLV